MPASQRSIWTGAITFGLVTVPVKLYPAVREENISFHLLHDQDHARLKRRMVCSADEKEVHPEHMVKGFEIAPDQYVIIEDSEIEAVQPKRSKTIEIEDFVDLGEIDPLYYDRPYYVVPQETGTKPYQLLVEAMEKAGKVGIARFVMRNRENLCALRPLKGVLVMETMHFGAEVIPVDRAADIPSPAKVEERELKMARQLIESLAGSFDPDKYKDEYVQAIRELVEKKAAGEKIVTAPEPEKAPGRTTNLMEALQASLARARSAAKTPERDKAHPEKPPVQQKPKSKRRKGS